MRRPDPGDIVLIISPDRKRFVLRLSAGAEMHTHRGIVYHDDILAQPLGGDVRSHSGHSFTVLAPSMEEALMTLKRASQIVYPKEIGYILLKLSIVPGRNVIEAGSGSGVLTAALARYVTPGGRVFSYEAREDMLNLARNNVDRLGLLDAVTFHHRSIEDGFVETDADALFLDVREPWLYLRQAVAAMADGAFFGAIVPTVNQLVELTKALDRKTELTDAEAVEFLMRQYKAVPERVRPLDRLTAHTGYLVFARRVKSAALRRGTAAAPGEWPESGGEADDEAEPRLGGSEPDGGDAAWEESEAE